MSLGGVARVIQSTAAAVLVWEALVSRLYTVSERFGGLRFVTPYKTEISLHRKTSQIGVASWTCTNVIESSHLPSDFLHIGKSPVR